MTTELAQPPQRSRRVPGGASIAFARLVIFWERAWPAALPALAIPFTILLISLFGLWRLVPAWLHWSVLFLGGLAFAMMVWRDFREVRWPSRKEAQARLEADGKTEHAPLQALDDSPFENAQSPSPSTAPLWRAHMVASAERARKARLAGIRATADTRDPYALRYTALGLLAVALVAAGDDWQSRLKLALAPGHGQTAGRLIADLWIEPPAYTGKAPIYLLRAGEAPPSLAEQVNAPQGSILVAQVNGRSRPRLDFTTDGARASAEFERNNNAARAQVTLNESGVVRLRLGGVQASWPVGVLADTAPSVEYTQTPAGDEQALLAFSIALNDDYGVTQARLQFRLDPDQERPLDAPELDGDALGQIRAADMDGVAGAAGERTVMLDLQPDPWAGLGVLAKVIVTDGAGQTGETAEVAITLPARKFFNPLAKAVIEQRQTLSVAATNWARAGRSLDAVTLAPDVFFEDTTDYLLLRTAFWRVMRQNGDGFEDAVEKFWPLALQLEDKALELARQRLEAAEEALRQALENGASDEEIARLVEELRQAMNDYLTALAQSGQTDGERAPQNAQQLDQSDLDEMLDAIRDLAQSGAANAARQMLSDLENMLDNLRMTQGGEGGGQPGPGSGEGGAAGKAGELIGRQRELSDQSFERGQTPGETGGDLAGKEGALGGDLDQLIDELQGGGDDPDGDAARALGKARNDMRDAEQALGNDNFDAATSAMERAIGNLRDGAEALAREQMRQAGAGQQGREGPGGGPTDPLGRPIGSANGEGVEVPEETEAGRTRAVIEELRRRLGEQGRSEEEIDYLERLLDRF